MNYSELHVLPHDDEVLPVELPVRQAFEVYFKRLLVFLIVTLINILLFLAYLEFADIRAVLRTIYPLP